MTPNTKRPIDPASCQCFLFPKLKKNSLRYTHFHSTEDIHTKTAEIRKDISLSLSVSLSKKGGRVGWGNFEACNTHMEQPRVISNGNYF
jgi:hypothetical protein